MNTRLFIEKMTGQVFGTTVVFFSIVGGIWLAISVPSTIGLSGGSLLTLAPIVIITIAFLKSNK